MENAMEILGTIPTPNIVKSVYGKEQYNKQIKQQFGDSFIIGWYVLGYDTLEDLQTKFSDEEILDLWKTQKNN